MKIILFSLLLVGCAAAPTKLLCPELPKYNGDLQDYTQVVVHLYAQCAKG